MSRDDLLRSILMAITRRAATPAENPSERADESVARNVSGDIEQVNSENPVGAVDRDDLVATNTGHGAPAPTELSLDEQKALRQTWLDFCESIEQATPGVNRAAIMRRLTESDHASSLWSRRMVRRRWALALAASLFIAAGVGVWSRWLATPALVTPAASTGERVATVNSAIAIPAPALNAVKSRPKRSPRPELAWDDHLDRRMAAMQKKLRRAPIAEARAPNRIGALQQRISTLEKDLKSSTL